MDEKFVYLVWPDGSYIQKEYANEQDLAYRGDDYLTVDVYRFNKVGEPIFESDPE
jgi:hypothetical protein